MSGKNVRQFRHTRTFGAPPETGYAVDALRMDSLR